MKTLHIYRSPACLMNCGKPAWVQGYRGFVKQVHEVWVGPKRRSIDQSTVDCLQVLLKSSIIVVIYN